MNFVDNGKPRFVEYQWCQHLTGTPTELNSTRMVVFNQKQIAVMASGTTIACLCMECLVLFAERKLPLKPNPSLSS